MVPQKLLDKNHINPAYFSEEELEFLLTHVQEPTLVALRAAGFGVNHNAVRPLLEKVNDLENLQKHEGLGWIGVEKLKEGLALYLTMLRKWRSDRRKGAPKFPSLYTYTKQGKPVLGGIGADSGIVKTYFDEHGQRKSFIIELTPDGIEEWKPEWAAADEPAKESGIAVNHDLNRFECFCGHTETFRAESRASYNVARGRLSRHLRSAKDDLDRHREVYAAEFGS